MTQSRFASIACTVTVGMFAYLVISAAVSGLDAFFHEGAGVEEVSLGLLITAVALWFALAGHLRWQEWQIPAALALMLAREMDFDKRFTNPFGLLKLKTYTHDAPLHIQIIGGMAILFTLWVGFRILRRNAPLWWSRLRAGTMDAWLILGAALCGICAKTFDGLGRKLESFGIDLPEQINTLAGQSEEVLEALCYYMIVLAIARLTVPALRRAAGIAPVAAE